MIHATGFVFDADPRRPWLAARTARSLRRAGLADVVVCPADQPLATTAAIHRSATRVRPILALRAGTWLRSAGPFAAPPSPTPVVSPAASPVTTVGPSLVAVGLPWSGGRAADWRAVVGRCGGDFSAEPTLPPAAAVWLSADDDAAAQAARLRALFDGSAGTPPPSALAGAARRVVRWPALDVWSDEPAAEEPADAPRLRVLQIVTSLQQGGAERVTWDLHQVLPTLGVTSGLVSLGRPLRKPLPDLPDRVDLADVPADDRPAAVADLAARFGVDLIHAHLIRGDAAGELSRLTGVPLVMTVHNTRQGWPPGLETVGSEAVALLVACARAVERDVGAAGPAVPVRTAWNGIDAGAYERVAAGSSRGVARDAGRLTLACVANPRPQKRLHLLPAVLAAVRDELARRGDGRDVRLVLAGEAGGAAAAACLDEVWRAAAAAGVADRVEWTAGGRTVADVLADADVLVSVSAHEGLSLAQLEALAAGLPVVTTDVGGAAEVAWRNPAVTLVPADAPPAAFAAAVMEALVDPVAVGAGDAVLDDVAITAEARALRSRDREGAGGSRCAGRATGPQGRASSGPIVSERELAADAAVRSTSGPAGRLLDRRTSTPPLPHGRGSLMPVGDPAGESIDAAGPAAVRRDFSRERMAARYAWLYRAALGPARGDVLWLVANNLSVGGAQSSLRRLVKALHADGVPVRVAVLQEYADHPTSGRLDLLGAGVPVTVLPPAGTVEVDDAVLHLLGELSAAPPRSVTFWNVIQSYKVLLADALLRVPVYDVSPGEMYYDSLEKYLVKPRPGLPYRSARDYGERLAGVVAKYAAEAPAAADRLGAPVHVIPNGVPFPPDEVRRAMAAERAARAAAGRLVIGTAARLHPHKRIEDLVEAFRVALPRLPAETVFRVVGGPDAGCDGYVETLRERAAGLSVEWVGEVVGAGGTSAADGIHGGFDVFAMVSEPAGCPNASLEAMAAGLPVVATDVGGAGEQVIDGVNGRLVPPRDVAALAEALVNVGRCADRRRAMGQAAERRVEEWFSLAGMVRAYRAVVGGGGR